MADSKALANYRVIPSDKYAKGFLEWGLGFLANSFSFSKKYVFTRCLLVGFVTDSLYGVFYESFKKGFEDSKIKADPSFDCQSFEAVLGRVFEDPSVEEELYDFCESMITAIAQRFGNHKQYIISRCLLSGMSSDVAFGPRFGIMKSVYVQVGDSSGIISSKKFINDVLGSYEVVNY